jgi:predicted GNAT superfamily acetyltransferase
MYGSNTGSPLHGTLETDRWVAAWDVSPANGDATSDPWPNGVFVVDGSPDGTMPVNKGLSSAPVVRVAVPADFERLTHDQRVAWREATRRAFLHYLALGYHVSTFQRATKEQPPFYELTVDAAHS